MKKIKLVIFDLDGTLVDAYKAITDSLNFVLGRAGGDSVDGEAVKRTVGWGDTHLIKQYVPQQEVDKAISAYRQHHARSLESGTVFTPGAKHLLDELKSKGYKLAVASNRAMQYTFIILKHLQIQNTFDHILCGDMVTNPKPAPDMLNQILKHFKLVPDEAVYVGDMIIDVEAGHRAGIRTIAVLNGSSTKEEISHLEPFKITDNVYDVAGILERISY